MNRLMCVLAATLVLILTAGGDLNGYDRFGNPEGGPAINPGLSDHPWGGDKNPVAPGSLITVRNDGCDIGSRSSIIDRFVFRIVSIALPKLIDLAKPSVYVDDPTAVVTDLPSDGRNSLENQTRVER